MAAALRGTQREQIIKTSLYEYTLKNFTFPQMEAALARKGIKVHFNTLYRYLRDIKAELSEKRKMAMSERIDTELDILVTVRNRALDSYRLSLRDATSEEMTEESAQVDVADVTDNDDAALALQQLIAGRGNLNAVKRTVKRRSVGQSGDPRFLDVALKASAEIRKLIGVDPEEVKRLELVVTRDGFTIEELRNMEPADIATLLNEEVSAS